MGTSSRWWKPGVRRRHSHTSNIAAPPTSTQTKRQMTMTTPGSGLAGGCAAGVRRAPRDPPGTDEPRARPPSTTAAALGARRGLKTGSSSPHHHHPTPHRPGTQLPCHLHPRGTNLGLPTLPGCYTEAGGERESSQIPPPPPRRTGQPRGALGTAPEWGSRGTRGCCHAHGHGQVWGLPACAVPPQPGSHLSCWLRCWCR